MTIIPTEKDRPVTKERSESDAPKPQLKRPVVVSATPPQPVERPQPATAAIKVRQFTSWYGDFQALHDLNFDIPHQQITAIIGASGCGKSTFLRWINRMNDLIPDARTAGAIEIHGQDVLSPSTDVVELRRQVGMVFQKPNPFPKSIYENIVFGPKLHLKLSRQECDHLVEQSLRQAALWDEVKDRLKAPALSLSGGQQQRLCIARAVAVDPEVLLMDEPCSALDPRSTGAIEDLMARLRKRYTIVIVTHNMQQAARASDCCAFMHNGELVEFGLTEKVFTQPDNPQTENYITGRFG